MSDQTKIPELLNVIEGICRRVREKYVGDDVCGFCEYDGAYISESGNWENECPGFETDDCFRLSEDFRKKYGG